MPARRFRAVDRLAAGAEPRLNAAKPAVILRANGAARACPQVIGFNRWSKVGNHLADHRMAVHGAPNASGKSPFFHPIACCMHDLVAVEPEDRCAQQHLGVRVDQHLHETLRLAGFVRPAYELHRHLRAQHLAAAGASFALAHADATERRVDEQRVARDAVRDAA